MSEDERRDMFASVSIHIVDDIKNQPHPAFELKGWSDCSGIRSLVNILEDRRVVGKSGILLSYRIVC